MEFAGPLLPVSRAGGEQRLAEHPHETEALAPAGRRRGVQAQEVAAGAVAGDEVHLAEHQGRCATLLVGPLDPAAPDGEFRLAEEPVCAIAAGVGGAGEVEAGDEHPAIGGAPDVQPRLVDVQLLEAQVPQRARRQRADHQRQPQRLAPLWIQQDHVLEGEGGDQAFAAGGDVADAHRYPQDLAGAQFHRGAQVADSRHNE